MKTVIIDPGHGGWDTGAIALDGKRESDFNLQLAFAVRDELARFEVGVILTRQADVGLSPTGKLAEELNRRAQIANAAGADLLVSLHHDATGKPDVRGASLWIWTSKSNADGTLAWYGATGNHTDPKTYPVAKAMVGAIRSSLGALGVPWRGFGDPDGIGCSNMGVIRATRGPALLIEAFHGSNAQDTAIARAPEFIPTLARTIADSIAGALALPAKAQPIPVAPDVRVVLYDKEITCNGKIEEGKTRADIRPVLEAMGVPSANITYDSTTRTVTVQG